MFLFVALLGKQSVSQEGLGIGRQKFKGDSGVMGWKTQEAGGDLVGTGLLLSPAVLSMSFLTEGQPQVRRPPRRKERERRGGSNAGYRPEEGGGGVESVYMSLCVCVCFATAHTVIPSPPLFSHTQGQRDQTSLWPLIYLYARSSLCSERETREMHLSKY